MKSVKYLLLVSILVMGSNIDGLAQVGLNKVAQSTMNFLLIGISPKAGALGEAFCASGQGAESIFYNPAGIVESSGTFDARFYLTQWIADINYTGGAFVWNAGSLGSLGASFLFVDYGSIRGTSLLTAAEKDLYPLGYKDLGKISNVGAYALGLSYGRAISTQFFIGGNMRLVGQNLGQSRVSTGSIDNNATKLAFDAGVKYYTGLKGFRFGMDIRNFSASIKREEISEQLPLLFTMGVAMNLLDLFSVPLSEENELTLAVDFLHPNNYSERMNIGLELRMFDKVAFRGGYQTNQDIASWSTGIGVQIKIGDNPVEFDYSYSSFKIFDGVNRLSLGLTF